MSVNITVQTLHRLPKYLNYLKSLPKDGSANISATAIAEKLALNDVVVRKDLDAVSDGGKPRIGYIVEFLIADLERVLGYNDINNAVLVGVGRLGNALMSYGGFSDYGLNIIAGFDVDDSIIDTEVNGKKVLPFEKLTSLCGRMKIQIGIITVPAREAQGVCNALIKGGIMAIWNFAPAHLNVPDGILVQNENMATSLAILSRHLTEKLLI